MYGFEVFAEHILSISKKMKGVETKGEKKN